MRTRIFILLIAIVAAFGAVIPLRAQSPQPTWTASYYNNKYFLDPPILQRVEARIGYDWGAGSPIPGVQTDNFTVRWGTNVNLDAATYRFYVLADDEVKVIVDYNTVIIDTIDKGRPGVLLTQDLNLGTGPHHIQVDFRENGGNAFIFFSFEGLNDGVQGPGFITLNPTPPPAPAPVDVDWLAEYFNNRDLSGTPVLVTREPDPTHDWGETPPNSRLSDSNYSVRWTRNISLAGGVYRLRVVADDGVRVYIDNTLMIDEWHISTGETFIKDFSLSSGVHLFRVEYFEVGGTSYIQYSLTGGSSPTPVPQQPQQPQNPTGATAIVTTGRLNVRALPNATAAVLTRVSRGNVLTVVGINPEGTWVQLNVNGIIGWVNRRFVSLNNTGGVPTTGNPSQPPTSSGYNVLADRFSVNIRTGPGTEFEVLGSLRFGQQAVVVGRNANNTWWKVSYRGLVGWVSAVYTTIDPAANLNLIPITNQ